jgi:hypothetical protein
MVDFSNRQASIATGALNEVLGAALDRAISAKSKAEYDATRGSGEGEVAKKRIGAGYIGVECARELAFRFHKYPKEERESTVSKGELQRHAESGHWTEARTAEWLRLIGFNLRTDTGRLNSFGRPEQIGWKAARDTSTSQYRMAGEVDGVIDGFSTSQFSVPEELAAFVSLIKPPCIWESKKATDKKWKKFCKEKVKGADPKYYGQLQTNMAYMGVEQTLFSMLNLDNMKFYFEIVPFVLADAQAISDRAVKVMQSEGPFEMPALCRSVDDFNGRFCDFHGQCQCGLVIEPPQPTQAQLARMIEGQEPKHTTTEWVTPRPIFNPNFKVST